MNLKKLCIIIGLVFVFSVNVFASNNVGQKTNQVVNESLSGSRGSATYSFSVSATQLNYRVYINNTSTVSYVATVGGNTFTIPAGSSVTKIYIAGGSGNRSVDITSKDGSALKGDIAVKIASTLSELQ